MTEFPGLTALAILHDYVRDCTRCELSKGRKQVVFGTGNSEEPDICFVGEGPGADEDESGYPFVGRAGAMLDKVIAAMGYKRGDVYITNAVSCRPPGNRTPANDEVAACRPVWTSQVIAVAPKVIVCLGGTACRAVLECADAVGAQRGKWHEWRGIPVRVTYHPSYLLREPSGPKKQEVWKDMQEVLARLKTLRGEHA